MTEAIELAKREKATLIKLYTDARDRAVEARLDGEAAVKIMSGLRLKNEKAELISKTEKLFVLATNWYQLANTYELSIKRLNGIILFAEQAEIVRTQVCKKHNRFNPCIDCFKEQQK